MSQRSGGLPNILQLVRTTSLKVLGKPGATAGAGLAGGTASGAPTSGQFDVGDVVVATTTGHVYVCTVAGSPGTWVDVGATGAYTDPLTTRGDLVVRGAASTGRLALGASGYVLTSDGTDAGWAAAAAGFADPTTTKGDLIVHGASTTRLGVGSNDQVLTADSAQSTGLKWATPAGGSLTTASAQLGTNVTLTSANTYYDVVSVSLAAGTWLLCAAVTCYYTAGAAHFTAKLWDGTTTAASGEATSAGAALRALLSLGYVVAPGSTTTYKVSVASNAGSAVVAAAAPENGAGNTASSIWAVKVG